MLKVSSVYIKPRRGQWLINNEDSPEQYSTLVKTRDEALYLGRRLAQTWEVLFKIYDNDGELISEEDYRDYYG